jgi:hypothetical protein
MEKRVKTFWNDTPDSIDNDINDFLSQMGGNLHEVNLSFAVDPHRNDSILVAMLIYTPEDEE